MDLIIRKVDDEIVMKLEKIAKKQNLSRESFIRELLKEKAIEFESDAAETVYQKLIQQMIEEVQTLNMQLLDMSRKVDLLISSKKIEQ